MEDEQGNGVPKEPQLAISLPGEEFGGVWANFAVVSHSMYEFTVDFVRIDHAQADGKSVPGRVVSRVNLSPLMVTQLMEALSTNWDKYAAKAMPQEVRDDDSGN